MHTNTRGFGLPLLLAVLAIVLVSGGAYVYIKNTKSVTPAVPGNDSVFGLPAATKTADKVLAVSNGTITLPETGLLFTVPVGYELISRGKASDSDSYSWSISPPGDSRPVGWFSIHIVSYEIDFSRGDSLDSKQCPVINNQGQVDKYIPARSAKNFLYCDNGVDGDVGVNWRTYEFRDISKNVSYVVKVYYATEDANKIDISRIFSLLIK